MLQIRKKAEDVFKHFNDQGNFLLSRGYFKIDNGVFFIVEAGGARRNLYPISEITVYDDTDSGTPETFTTDIALYERLVELRYNLVETSSGGFASDLKSSPQDYPFVDTNTFVLPDNYVIVSVHANGSLYKKLEYSKSGNNLLIIDSLEVGDIVEVRGVVAIGSFGTGGGATTFLELTDTPSTYIGQAGKFPKVNAGENGLEFDDVPSGNTEPIVITANKIAVNGETYHNLGNNTYTDPTPVNGKGYYVNNATGTITVGGISYTRKGLFSRIYDGTIWITTPPFKESYRQNNGFDFSFDRGGTFTGAAINGGAVSIIPKAPLDKYRNVGFTIRGNSSNADSGYKYYILNDRPVFVGAVIFAVIKPEKINNNFIRIGMQVDEGFTPFVDSGNMICIEINNDQLVFKTALSGTTSTSSPALTLLNTNALYIKWTIVSMSEINCVVKNTFGGTELYNKSLTTNLPITVENGGTVRQLRFMLAGTTTTASSADICQFTRIAHFEELPNFLTGF